MRPERAPHVRSPIGLFQKAVIEADPVAPTATGQFSFLFRLRPEGIQNAETNLAVPRSLHCCAKMFRLSAGKGIRTEGRKDHEDR